MVRGEGHTHEMLIRATAEQMGSAHEGDGVERHLLTLSGTVVSNQTPLNSVLMSGADLVLEVGERVLDEAHGRLGFTRTPRPDVSMPSQPRGSYSDNSSDFEGSAGPVLSEGNAVFLINHSHTDWKTNTYSYDVGLVQQGPLAIRTVKHSDGSLEVLVKGLGRHVLSSRKPIPERVQPGVMIGLSWKDNKAVFYLDGMRLESVDYSSDG